jgi:subtilase family serine protease
MIAGPAAPRTASSPADRSIRRNLGAILIVLVLAASGFLVVGAGSAAAVAPIGLIAPLAPGNGPTGILSGTALQQAPVQTQASTPLQSLSNVSFNHVVAPTYPTSFTVGFQMSNESQLEQLVQAQSSPGSPLFHHWLTLDQERAQYGPNPVVYQDTINYFTSLGLKVETKGLLSVSFTGSAAETEAAFHTNLENVSYGTGSTGVGNAEPLSIPAPIAKGIVSIDGLDPAGIAKPTSMVDPMALSEFGQPQPMANGVTPASPVYLPYDTNQGNLSTVFNFSQAGFFWFEHFSLSEKRTELDQVITPGALAVMYNDTQLLNAGYNGDSTGTPITIAIIMAGGINPGDLEDYGAIVWNNPNQIMDRLTANPIDGAYTTNGTQYYQDGASSEMALDLEFSSSLSPAAHLLPTYGPCLCTNVLDDDYASLENMAKAPNIISNSWGGSEDTWPDLYGPAYGNALTMHEYFIALDARGSTVLASTGDGGGFDTGSGILSGSFPATDPYVLGVNGARTVAADSSGLSFNPSTAYDLLNLSIGVEPQTPTLINAPVHADRAASMASESYWYVPYTNYTLTNTPPYASGGFDTSYWFNQSWFEHGYDIPDLGRSLGSGVAATADFNTSIFFDGTMQFFWGGTSFACPATAGMLATIEDYLVAHGKSGYLGDGNAVVYDLWNAYSNGNLTLNPFYQILNGTSYWGNYGVEHGYEFPPGQKFPTAANGLTTYGNTTPGWNLPDGFGNVVASNFAYDLLTLEDMPGTFMTVNGGGTAYDVGAWDYMELNHTYSIDVNTTTPISADSPVVTVVFHPDSGTPTALQEPLTLVASPALGERFSLDTGVAPFNSPGFVVFEYGDASNSSLGFAYDFISYPVPAGTLNVSVVEPSSGPLLSGYPSFNIPTGLFFSPVTTIGQCCTNVPNTFTVLVTLNGVGVYNALVTASVPSTSILAWQNSRAYDATNSYGNPHAQNPTTLSWTYTNETGYAVVYTWNSVGPAVYTVNASLGSAKAQTTYNTTPGVNVKTTDVAGGKYSNFNVISYILEDLRQSTSAYNQQLWAPNSLNQSELYDLLYGWQGEILPVSTNYYNGTMASGVHVWLGNYDGGGQNKFYTYEGSGGIVGVTNTSGTSNITDPNGNSSIFIPDNQSDSNWFVIPGVGSFGLAAVAASSPGQYNRTFSYTESCFNTYPGAIKQVAVCQYNDSEQRNYTSAPIVILANPVNVTTQTTAGTARSFFGAGSQIALRLNVQLPDNDPFVTGPGYNWDPSTEHVVTAEAYVDNEPVANLTPPVSPYWQNFTIATNLTQSFSEGVHTLDVVVTDSEGHIFTRSHTFIIGSIDLMNLNLSDTYTVLPYTLNWSYSIPSDQISNHTFSQSLDIKYEAPGCGSTTDPCPTVVNLTLRIKDGVTTYNQSLNTTLMNQQGFYSGAAELPPGQYAVTVWLNANHSGSLATSVSTYFVFAPLTGTIDGPSNTAVVPVGNVTLSYSYSGEYVENATLLVFPVGSTTAVFSAGAFVPGIGSSLRGGAATWTAVAPGSYQVVLTLGAPYAHYNATSNITVSLSSGTTYINQSHPSGVLAGLNPATTATVLAVLAAIIGLLIGLVAAPALRGTPKGSSAASAGPLAPWQEDHGKPATTSSGRPSCPVCHEGFETEFALKQHEKITHGMEE